MEKVRPVRPKDQLGPDYIFSGNFTLDWGLQTSGEYKVLQMYMMLQV
jgi:hypothetical protein